MSLPRYVVGLHTQNWDEIVWPERYQYKQGYESEDKYRKWVEEFLENYEEECILFEGFKDDVILVLYRLKEVG